MWLCDTLKNCCKLFIFNVPQNLIKFTLLRAIAYTFFSLSLCVWVCVSVGVSVCVCLSMF